jgi:hypothetical protein
MSEFGFLRAAFEKTCDMDLVELVKNLKIRVYDKWLQLKSGGGRRST